MKLHILSDLHLEFGQFYVPDAERDVIVLAGDIAQGRQALEFVRDVALNNPATPVIFTPGNHEYYQNDMTMLELDFAECAKRDAEDAGIVNWFWQNRCEVIDGVKFAVCTLWTNFRNEDPMSMHMASHGIGDFMWMKQRGARFTVEAAVQLNKTMVQFLKHQKDVDVVVTHFPPVVEAVMPQFEGDPYNPYFVNDMEDLVREVNPKLWVYGHTHGCGTFNIGRTKFVCNARGYASYEKTGFDKGLIIEI